MHASESMEHEEASLLETRTRMEQQLQSRDENITKLGARCAELQSKMERAVRDQRTATSEREVSVVHYIYFFFICLLLEYYLDFQIMLLTLTFDLKK